MRGDLVRAHASVWARVWLLRAHDESTLRAHVWLLRAQGESALRTEECIVLDTKSKEREDSSSLLVHPSQPLTTVQHFTAIQAKH